jgi:hypothetical protein
MESIDTFVKRMWKIFFLYKFNFINKIYLVITFVLTNVLHLGNLRVWLLNWRYALEEVEI